MQLPMTSEDETTMRPMTRGRLLFAGMLCVALVVGSCALVLSTTQLASGAAKPGKPEFQQGLHHSLGAQEAIQRWLDPGLAHPPKHALDFQLDDWEWSEELTLRAGTGTARINAGSDKSAEVQGVIQEWSEDGTADTVLKEMKFVTASAKDPKGQLDHIQLLFTSDWAAVYHFSNKEEFATPLVFMLDGLIMHKHYNDKLDWLPVPGKKKAFYAIKPRSEMPKYLQSVMDKKR